MEPFVLVNQAIDLLSPHLPAILETGFRIGEEAAARVLYEVIADKLRGRDEEAALEEFANNPANNSLVKRILREAVRDDPEFATELATAVAAVTPAAVSANVVNQVGNTAGGDIVGRDSIRNTTNTNTNTNTTHNKKSSNPGLALGVVVIVAIIAVCLIGRAILSSASGGGLGGSSTCQDFLQSADTASKAEVMKKLYLNKNKPHLAADPFIIQNTEYFCGNNPKSTLDQLASVRRDG